MYPNGGCQSEHDLSTALLLNFLLGYEGKARLPWLESKQQAWPRPLTEYKEIRHIFRFRLAKEMFTGPTHMGTSVHVPCLLQQCIQRVVAVTASNDSTSNITSYGATQHGPTLLYNTKLFNLPADCPSLHSQPAPPLPEPGWG